MSRRRSRPNATGRGKPERFTRLDHDMQQTAAWRSLSSDAVRVLLDLWLLFNGSNNADLAYGVRQAAAVGVSRRRAALALDELVATGFLKVARPSTFDQKKLTRTWTITALPIGKAEPTRDYQDWRPCADGTPPRARARTREGTLAEKNSVPPLGQPSLPSGTVSLPIVPPLGLSPYPDSPNGGASYSYHAGSEAQRRDARLQAQSGAERSVARPRGQDERGSGGKDVPPYAAEGRQWAKAREAAGLTQQELAERVGVRQLDVSAIERGKQRPARRYLAGYEHAAGNTLEAVRGAVAAIEDQRAERKRAATERKAAAAERKAAGGPVEVAAPKPVAAAPGAEFPVMRCLPGDRAAVASARASLVSRVRKLGVDDPHAALGGLTPESFYQIEDAQRAGTLDDRALAKALGVQAPRAPVTRRNATATSKSKGRLNAKRRTPLEWSRLIRERREHLGLSESEVAALVGFSEHVIKGIETGQVAYGAPVYPTILERLMAVAPAVKAKPKAEPPVAVRVRSGQEAVDYFAAPWKRELRVAADRLEREHGVDCLDRVDPDLRARFETQQGRWSRALSAGDCEGIQRHGAAMLRGIEALGRALRGEPEPPPESVINMPKPGAGAAANAKPPRPGTGKWLRQKRLLLDVPPCEVAKVLAWREPDLHRFEAKNDAVLSDTQRKKLAPVFEAYAARAGVRPDGRADA